PAEERLCREAPRGGGGVRGGEAAFGDQGGCVGPGGDVVREAGRAAKLRMPLHRCERSVGPGLRGAREAWGDAAEDHAAPPELREPRRLPLDRSAEEDRIRIGRVRDEGDAERG